MDLPVEQMPFSPRLAPRQMTPVVPYLFGYVRQARCKRCIVWYAYVQRKPGYWWLVQNYCLRCADREKYWLRSKAPCPETGEIE